MSAKEQVKKPSKAPATLVAAPIPQTAPAVMEHEDERPGIETQLEGTARLGHSLGAVGVDSPSPFIIQRELYDPDEEDEFGEEDLDERQALLQRQEQPEEGQVGPQGGPVPPHVAAAIQRARSGGQPLEGALQEQMSANLGHDFRGVRVHTGPEADELNQQLQARAFTTGHDIFFGQGEYRPGASSGRDLIAHELSHVVQQSTGQAPVRGGGSDMTVRPAGDAFEQEADRVAEATTRSINTLVQRQLPEEAMQTNSSASRPESDSESLGTRLNSARGQDASPTSHIQRAPQFNHPSWKQISEKSAKIEAVKQAFATALALVEKAQVGVMAAGHEPSEQHRFITWFGDIAFRGTVLDNYKKIHNALNRNIDVWIDVIKTSPNTYAYIDTNRPDRVHLCKQFFDGYKSKAVIDSTAGTIIHELSHLEAQTDDHEYGQAACEALAVVNPADAVDNADNYLYYCESF